MSDFWNPSGELTPVEKLVLYPAGALAAVGWMGWIGAALVCKVLRDIWTP